jgi:hypothetical protein
MALFDSISGYLAGTNVKQEQEAETPPEVDDWEDDHRPKTIDEWEEFGQVFNQGPSFDQLTQNMIYPVNQDEQSRVNCVQRWTRVLNTEVELPQSQFVDEYIPLATESEATIWSKFLQRFNLFVSLTPSISDELSFDLAINDADVNVLIAILTKKQVKKFHINQKAVNLYLIEFDEIPILNGSSKENSSNPMGEEELDADEYNLFTSEETKKIFIANSPLFKTNGNLTNFYHNYNAMVVAIEVELAQVKFQYPKLIGRKIRKVLPYSITTKEELDVLSMTVPLFDINHFYIQFYGLTPVKEGTLVKFSLEAYNLQAPRTRPAKQT